MKRADVPVCTGEGGTQEYRGAGGTLGQYPAGAASYNVKEQHSAGWKGERVNAPGMLTTARVLDQGCMLHHASQQYANKHTDQKGSLVSTRGRSERASIEATRHWQLPYSRADGLSASPLRGVT
eukprot:1155444-Pelagomonas_calceolata.AAC.1